jgi:hypothetical protein
MKQCQITTHQSYVDPRIPLKEFPDSSECARCHDMDLYKEMYDIARYYDISEHLLCQKCIDEMANMPRCTYCGRRKHIRFEKDFRGVQVPVCRTCVVITEPGEEPKERHTCNCQYCDRKYED